MSVVHSDRNESQSQEFGTTWMLPITSLGLSYKISDERIATGIPRLDAMLGGKGFFRGSSILLSGTSGAGKTLPCGICHGPTLNGLGDVPGIAGRSPLNIARQLYLFGTEARSGPWAVLMKQVVEKLTNDDIVAITAFIASLDP